jgi:FHS family L-fucose permease-like MFS transporter
MTFLETAANPYMTVLGPEKTAPQRLNFAQAFNGLGAFIAAFFLSKVILSGKEITDEALAKMRPSKPICCLHKRPKACRCLIW